MGSFQLSPAHSKVLDITCLDTDYGTGRFLPSMLGEVVFSVLYIAWLCTWGCPETALTDRGTEAENDAVMNGLHSMGIHWRTALTEASWGSAETSATTGPSGIPSCASSPKNPPWLPSWRWQWRARPATTPRAHMACH